MQTKATRVPARVPELGGNTDTSLLKIIALAAMIFDHVGVAIFPGVMELRMIGRMALPLYVWCIIVGTEYTHNIFQYALRLLILAIISQPVNMMALSNSWTDLNILFLLCIGVLAIAAIQKKWHYSQFWGPALCLLSLFFISVDYGWKGLIFILVMYGARKTKSGLAAAFITFALFWGTSSYRVTEILGIDLTFLNSETFAAILQYAFRLQTMMWLSLPFILIQTHSNIKMPKWLGYGVYPLHLLAIILVMLLLGTPLSQLTAVLTGI